MGRLAARADQLRRQLLQEFDDKFDGGEDALLSLITQAKLPAIDDAGEARRRIRSLPSGREFLKLETYLRRD